jgi:regulator of sigma E protease
LCRQKGLNQRTQMDFSSLLTCIKDIFLTKQILFIVAGIVGVGFLVAWHELGHFIFAKLFGVKVPTFSIGMGPKLIKRQIGETEFTLSAIPMGGYVEIAFYPEEPASHESKLLDGRPAQNGEMLSPTDMGTTQTPDAHRYFSNKPYWQKMLVLSGGIAFNLIFAYVAFIGLYKVGMPITPFTYAENVKPIIKSVAPGSLAEKAGLKEGDKITWLMGHPVIAFGDNLNALREHLDLYDRLTATSLAHQPNNDIWRTVSLGIVKRPNEDRQAVTILLPNPRPSDAPKTTSLGIEFAREQLPPMSFTQAIQHGVNRVNQMIMMNFAMIKMMFKARSVEGIGGPVLMISLTVKSAEQGFAFFIAFLAFISVGLAIINLLPLPILDGGQALITTIESLLGRPLPLAARNVVAVLTWVLFIGLFGYLVVKDVRQLRALKKDSAVAQKTAGQDGGVSPIVTAT